MEELAILYQNAIHNPNNPIVKACYNQLKLEVLQQYKTIPVKVEFTTENPYELSLDMFQDIEFNSNLFVFTGGEPHELMKDFNNEFRAVHDFFGHYLNRNSFSWNGELKAYLFHSQTFSHFAQKALFTETLVQNAYYNVFKEYAEQKACIINGFNIYEKLIQRTRNRNARRY